MYVEDFDQFSRYVSVGEYSIVWMKIRKKELIFLTHVNIILRKLQFSAISVQGVNDSATKNKSDLNKYWPNLNIA